MVTDDPFAGAIEVSYGQIYLTDSDMEPPDPELAFDGQQNGLCGAATEGKLLMRTGLLHGTVKLVVELRQCRPEFGSEWEEIVEAAFVCGRGRYVLWGPDEESHNIDLPAGRYGIAYCARGMEAASAAESNYDGVPLDEYLLAMWPAEGMPTPERIVRQTSEIARYWHADDQLAVVQDASDERSGLGTGSPARRVAGLRLDVDVLNELNRTLVHALARSPDELQRSVARWAALRALLVAGLASDPAIRPVVVLLELGQNLPAPFNDVPDTMEAHAGRLGRTLVRRVRGLSREDNEWAVRELAALISVPLSAAQDSLEAAVGAVTQAAIAYGADAVDAFADALYQSYPTLEA